MAIAGIMHDAKTAVYVLANRDHAELRHAILYQALDLWAFDDPSRDWHKEILSLYDGLEEKQEAAEQKLLEDRKTGTQPTLPMAAYTGTYVHPMLGEAEIGQNPEGIRIRFNDFVSFNAIHWHYDTFRTTADNRYLWEIPFSFTLGDKGEINELRVFGESFSKTD